MTYEEAISYIEAHTWSATRLGLERTFELLKRLGNPQKRLKFVHIAGSNGKGSTAAMLESVLRHAGYKTGLYTSPHLVSFRERMRVDGRCIPEADLARITGKVRLEAEKMADHPSQFELSTALAFCWFLEQNCHIVVLEVGMGGALDSTNVIDSPEVAVLTNIGLEHTEFLGKTLEEIAATKAGIVKAGTTAVCYNGSPVVTEVIKNRCGQVGADFRLVDFGRVRPVAHDLSGQTVSLIGKTIFLPLVGVHQIYNAATAVTALEVLREKGWRVSDKAVEEGLTAVQWPARFEVLRKDPLFILDGGHNPQCARVLADTLEDYLPGEKVTFLMGVLSDKNWKEILDIITPFARNFLCVTPDSPRALPGLELAEELTKRGFEADVFPSIPQAVKAARGKTVAFGSLYMAGEIRTSILEKQAI